ncbi:MAG: rhodanese-like domain-containing protein [Chloroflexaceae bacterium]|nr:rhodanese-like domain-containing protein [Chloroflexaceae bacterium]
MAIPQPYWRYQLWRAVSGGMLATSLLLAGCANPASPVAESTTAAPPAATAAPAAPPAPAITVVAREDGQRISVADAKLLFDAKQALFVDTRDASDFAQSHIPGAVLYQSAEYETQLKNLPAGHWVVFY